MVASPHATLAVRHASECRRLNDSYVSDAFAELMVWTTAALGNTALLSPPLRAQSESPRFRSRESRSPRAATTTSMWDCPSEFGLGGFHSNFIGAAVARQAGCACAAGAEPVESFTTNLKGGKRRRSRRTLSRSVWLPRISPTNPARFGELESGVLEAWV